MHYGGRLLQIAHWESSPRPEGAHLMRVNHGDTLLSVQPHGRRFAVKQESNLGCHLSYSEDVAWMAETDNHCHFLGGVRGTCPSFPKIQCMYGLMDKNGERKISMVTLAEVVHKVHFNQTSVKVSLSICTWIYSRCKALPAVSIVMDGTLIRRSWKCVLLMLYINVAEKVVVSSDEKKHTFIWISRAKSGAIGVLQQGTGFATLPCYRYAWCCIWVHEKWQWGSGGSVQINQCPRKQAMSPWLAALRKKETNWNHRFGGCVESIHGQFKMAQTRTGIVPALSPPTWTVLKTWISRNYTKQSVNVWIIT